MRTTGLALLCLIATLPGCLGNGHGTPASTADLDEAIDPGQADVDGNFTGDSNTTGTWAVRVRARLETASRCSIEAAFAGPSSTLGVQAALMVYDARGLTAWMVGGDWGAAHARVLGTVDSRNFETSGRQWAYKFGFSGYRPAGDIVLLLYGDGLGPWSNKIAGNHSLRYALGCDGPLSAVEVGQADAPAFLHSYDPRDGTGAGVDRQGVRATATHQERASVDVKHDFAALYAVNRGGLGSLEAKHRNGTRTWQFESVLGQNDFIWMGPAGHYDVTLTRVGTPTAGTMFFALLAGFDQVPGDDSLAPRATGRSG